jgi:GTP cyclohydrolase II
MISTAHILHSKCTVYCGLTDSHLTRRHLAWVTGSPNTPDLNLAHRPKEETGLRMDTIQHVASAGLATRYGEFTMHVFEDTDNKEHVALTVGTVDDGEPVLVRLHSECLTGDVFGSYRCDCGEQLDDSMRILQAEERGVLLYLRQEGRGIGLANKVRAYALQEEGYDTVEANVRLGLPEDARDYAVAAAMLRRLGIRRVMLLTNNPSKIDGLEQHDIEIAGRVPVRVVPRPQNVRYLQVKQEKMGHLYPPLDEVASPWAAGDD